MSLHALIDGPSSLPLNRLLPPQSVLILQEYTAGMTALLPLRLHFVFIC